MKNLDEQRLEHIIRRMHTDRSVDAPVDAIKYAKNLYRTRAVEPKASIVQRVLAVMRVDLAPGRAAFGERSPWGGGARQILFDAGESAVDLRVTAVKNGVDVRGQILGDWFENGEIEIANDQNSVKAAIDDTSGFIVSGLAAGEYSLTIKGKNTEIFIEQVNLR